MKLQSKTFANKTNHIALLVDDGTHIKYLTQDQYILNIMLSGRRDVDVDEIMYLLDEKDLKLIKKHC
jgi:hypothetical protein